MGKFDGMDLEPALREVYGSDIPTDVQRLGGQASTRSYYRLSAPGRDPSSLIIMRLPEDVFGSDEGPSDAARPKALPFLEVAELFAKRGLPVPKVFSSDLERRVLLLEDLGDESFEARLRQSSPEQWRAQYAEAVDLMVQMHERLADVGADTLIRARSFDRELLRWELDHFRKWGLEKPFGPLSTEHRESIESLFDGLADWLAASPKGVVHRDYQSRNLHWSNGQLVIIDFQDAMTGPQPYDLVALLCDSYVSLGEPLQREMVERYASARGLELQAFEQAFWRQAVQRKLKDAGRFIFIDRVRSNPDFLQWFGQSIAYVGRALSHLPDLLPLTKILSERIPGFPDEVPVPAAHTGENVGED